MKKNSKRSRTSNPGGSKNRSSAAGRRVWPFRFRSGECGRVIDPGTGRMARKVRAGWQSRPIGSFCSSRAISLLEWESSLELKALHICEYDPNVEAIRTQPFKVEYGAVEPFKATYPDFELRMTDGEKKVVQVKYEKALLDEDVARRLFKERRIFEALGWGYEIWTESFIDMEPRMKTLKLIHYYRRHTVADELRNGILTAVNENIATTVSSLRSLMPSGVLLEPTILTLLARRVLKLDLMQPFGPDTRLYLAA